MPEALKVKIGDKVIVSNRFHERIAKVEKITPTGRIRVEGDSSYFNKYGWEMGGDVWSRSYLTCATEEDVARIKQKQTIDKAYKLMRNYNLNNLTFDQSIKIIEILENKEE